MDRPIKKKKPDQAPDWLIYSLKGLLLFLLFWNINKQFPDGYFAVTNKRISNHRSSGAPYVEEISYNQLLSTTQPKLDHFMEWGATKIPYLDPEIEALEKDHFNVYSKKEFAKIWVDSFSLQYKGYILNPNKLNAIFLLPDSTSITCTEEGDFTDCFYATLQTLEQDFTLWLSIETEEENTFFTRIKVGQKELDQFVLKEEDQRFWKKLISRDKHKSIDNLTVVKPIFKNHEYIFKWGQWERHAHGPRGGRRVKIGIKEFKDWINHQPYLYKDQEYVPFSIYINHWNKKEWNQCQITRRTKKAPLFAYNECFKNLVEKVKIGQTLSIFIIVKGDFIKTLSPNTLSALPGFIFNDQYIQSSIPIEIVADSFTPNHAPLKLTTSTFRFQLNSSLGDQSIVKMDKYHPKNESLFKHYSETESAKIIHVDNYKTIRRVITQDDIFITDKEIDKTYTLPDKVFKTETYPEFYDFNIQPPLIKLRGLSTVLDKTAYDLGDFKQSKEGFEFYIGTERVKLLQVNFIVVPKEGKAIQYITNNFTRNDIVRRLRKIKPETSLYFDKILFERANGEQMVFPLTTAMHLK